MLGAGKVDFLAFAIFALYASTRPPARSSLFISLFMHHLRGYRSLCERLTEQKHRIDLMRFHAA